MEDLRVMLKIKNNEWQRFSNGAIIVIADELGCPYEYPKMELPDFLKRKDFTNFTIQKGYDEEQKRVDKINGERFDEYMNNIIEWLKEKRYIV